MTALGTLRAFLPRLAWLAVAAVIAAGSAGLVTAMQRQPAATEPELTFAGDEAARPALDAATDELRVLSDEVEVFGSMVRQTLAAVVGGDVANMEALINLGNAQLATVDRQAAELEAAVAAVPGMEAGSELAISPDLRRRHAALVVATGLTGGFDAGWGMFTGRALAAASLTTLLTRHDQETAAAASEGSAAHYEEALTLLDRSDATIAEGRALAQQLGEAAEVPTLVTWLDRNSDYDAALRDLYQSLVDARGRVTDKVRAAFAAEKEARARLPEDTRGLLVIMAEVAQGGLNQAVISIEEARGSLSAALDAQAEPGAGSAPPG